MKRVLLYAVPNNGAALASVSSHLSWHHAQLRQLCKDADLIRQVAQGWERNKISTLVDVHYVIAALDKVVDEQSARETWGNERIDVIADRGHIDVVKPRGADDLSYLILKNCMSRSVVQRNTSQLTATAVSESERIDRKTNSAPRIEQSQLRVALSAILRIEQDGRYLLVRNLHRPESFAPFGGVYKFFTQAKAKLDEFSFRLQAADSDMRNDIRGFIAPDDLPAFREWFRSSNDRESSIDCLRRELREELVEVGLDAALVSTALQFRHIRSVQEGPEYIASQGYHQFRLFDVFDLIEDTKSEKLLAALRAHSANSPILSGYQPMR